MPALLNLVPLQYRILALLAIAAAFYGYGWVNGAAHGEKNLEAFQAQVEKAGEKQVAATTAAIVKQKAITKGVSDDYAKNLARALARFDGGLHDNSGGSDVPTVSRPPVIVDALAGDTVLATDYIRLEGLCAATTQQLVSLQAWVTQQAQTEP